MAIIRPVILQYPDEAMRLIHEVLEEPPSAIRGKQSAKYAKNGQPYIPAPGACSTPAVAKQGTRPRAAVRSPAMGLSVGETCEAQWLLSFHTSA